MRTRLGACLLVGAVALIGAGCGDDDEGTTAASGAPPTKEEFIAQADQICADGNAEIAQAAQETFSEGRTTPEGEEAFVTDALIPSTRRQIDDVRALTPPEGDEQDVAEILDSAQSALDQVEEDPATVTQTQEGSESDPFAESSKLAADYGLEECAE